MTKGTGFKQKIEGWGDANWKHQQLSQKLGFFHPLYFPLAQTQRNQPGRTRLAGLTP